MSRGLGRCRRIARLVVAASLVAAALTAGMVVSPTASSPAQAATTATATTAGFQAGDIISDAEFTNTASMSAAQVQSFLDGEVTTCAAGYTCLESYRQTTTSKPADAYCSSYSGAGNELASTIVWKVSQSCGINPQVLIVLLQKEQGLVQSSAPSAYAYQAAVGYACPDTSGCSATYGGFFNQIYYAAHQFQVYARNPASFRFRAGFTNSIQYSPDASCGSASVYIQNQATASLYNYTPYTPNSAALAAGYGSAPCGAYGNRNFYLYFTNYFGNPSNWLTSASFEGGSTVGWNYSNGFVNRSAVQNANQAQSGSWFLATNTPVGGRSASQDIARTTQIGEQATATVWLKSSSATPFTGKLVLWGLGGVREQAVTTYSVGSTWTPVTVALPVRASAHTAIRLDIYLYTLGTSLWVDNTSVSFGAAPVLQNKLSNPSFEGTFAQWVPGNGFINQQIYQNAAQAETGSWFAAANTPVGGRSFSQTVPVSATTGDLWTAAIWLKSSSSAPFTGKLALWGLGGSTPFNSVQTYTVGSRWTRVAITLPVGAVVPTSLKLEVYLNTTSSTGTLWLDGGVLSKNVLASPTFDTSGAGWSRSASTVNFAVYPVGSNPVPDGAATYAASNVGTAGGSVSQTVALQPTIGDLYTAGVWVRAESGTLTGRLALWGLGSTAAVAVTPFTATTTWQLVTVQFPVSRSDYSTLKFELYEDTPGHTVQLDGAQLY